MRLDLRHRWADGTTQLLFEPVELLERLAALTPRPRTPGAPDARFPARWGGSLLLYCGVLGARSAWRSRLQARELDPAMVRDRSTTAAESSSRATSIPSRTNWLWAELMQRSFGFDVLACPRCGDRLELIALIEEPTVIRRILSHLGVPTEVPAARPARPPPLPIGRSDPWYDADEGIAP